MSTHVAATENSRFRIVLASLIGTSIEYYDFYAYLTASLLVFPQLFFPSDSYAVAQLASLATFGLAFFARPLGAILFGHFGDRYGRKSPLIASLLTMGIATFLIGCLPTVSTFAAAPFLLAALRLGQGIGLGGEWSGAALIAAEAAPKHRRGLYGTLPQFGAPIGFFLANLIFVLLYVTLPRNTFMEYGWRVPFLLSAVLVIIGLVLRIRLAESVVYQRSKSTEPAIALPFIHAIRTTPVRMLRGIGVLLAPYAIFYLITTFALSYASAPSEDHTFGQKSGLGFGIVQCLLMLMIGTLFQAVMVGVTGLLADHFGRKRVLIVSYCVTLLFGGSFGLWLAASTSGGGLQLFLIVGFALTGLVTGPIGAYLPELFPTNIRYTASAITYNFAGIIGAGILPLIAYGLWQRSGDITGVGLLLGAVSIVSILCLLGSNESSGYELDSIPAERKLSLIRPARDREEGFTVLELLVILFVCLALAAIAIPLYLNARGNSISDSVEDSVHATQQYVSQEVLVNFRTEEFDEKSLPPRDIISYDDTTVLVTGLNGSGEGSVSQGYEIRAYNAASSKYKDPRTAYVYVSTTGFYGLATEVDSSSL